MKINRIVVVAMLMTVVMATPIRAAAAPRLTFNPTSKSVSNGSQFDVLVGIDSGTEKVIGIDVVVSFDASKLEITNVAKGTIPDNGYNFTYTTSSPIIKNDTGRLAITLPAANSSLYDGVVANHELLKVTFKAKATGTAAVNYVCTANSVSESNIIGQSGNDAISCSANDSGSYTITDGGSGSTTTPTPTPTSSSSSTTTLPETGGVENTIGLVVFGLVTAVTGLWFAKL